MENFFSLNSLLTYLILGTSTLMIFSVLSIKASALLGAPSLLLFLGIGMFAGEDGPGKIAFENYNLTYVAGSIALVLIIFEGGFRSQWPKFKPILNTGISLSISAVAFTTALVGIFSFYFLDLKAEESFLLGSIVASTDAAAVFGILSSNGLLLKDKVKKLLEFEAGSNDPIAIFFTITIATMITDIEFKSGSIVLNFFSQIGFGFVIGCVFGRIALWMINNSNLRYDGLYSVLLISLVLFTFGVTNYLNGSGFLSVYVFGVILGSSSLIRKKSLLLFHDAVAWLAQIFLFLTLGLLVNPSHLLDVWKEGIILSIFLMLVARPISVFIATIFSKMSISEKTFISWVGLRGAAPILLATIPLSLGMENGEYIFNLVFFVVIFSVLVQGFSVSVLAKLLKLTSEETKEIDFSPSNQNDQFKTVEYQVKINSFVMNKKIVELDLPDGVLFICVERANNYFVPKGDSILLHEDKVRALVHSSLEGKVSYLFSS